MGMLRTVVGVSLFGVAVISFVGGTKALSSGAKILLGKEKAEELWLAFLKVITKEKDNGGGK